MIPLTDDELRGLVRDAIARVRGLPAGTTTAPRDTAGTVVGASSPTATSHVHASQVLFVLGPGGDADGNCVIEPAVRCNHCGYCQSYGH